MMMDVSPFEANEARQMDIVAGWQPGKDTQVVIRPMIACLRLERSVKSEPRIPCTRDASAFPWARFG
jgi:hypothetical protein